MYPYFLRDQFSIAMCLDMLGVSLKETQRSHTHTSSFDMDEEMVKVVAMEDMAHG